MKKMRSVLCAVLICFGLCTCVIWPTRQANAQVQKISETVQFRVVSAENFKPLQGARVIVANSQGDVIKTGLTNANGIWSAPLTVNSDPQFNGLGVVTAIAVANGHNENIVFEVPVRQGTVQPITLFPVQPRLRNEASASLGNLHHLDVIGVVDRYAKKVGLKRQPGLPGEFGYAPWSPEIRK